MLLRERIGVGAPVSSRACCVTFSSLPSGSAETVLAHSFSPTFVKDGKRPLLHSCLLVESSDAALPLHSVCVVNWVLMSAIPSLSQTTCIPG